MAQDHTESCTGGQAGDAGPELIYSLRAAAAATQGHERALEAHRPPSPPHFHVLTGPCP